MGRLMTIAMLMAITSVGAWSQCRVVNAASLQPSMPSAGAMAIAYCKNLLGKTGWYLPTPDVPLPFVLGGVQLSVNKGPAPLLAVYIPDAPQIEEGQINFQVPMARNSEGYQLGGTDTSVLVVTVLINPSVPNFDTGATAAFQTPLSPPGQGAFFSDENGYARARHASDDSPVTIDNPAHPAETILVDADDFFDVWPPPPMGIPVPDQPAFQFDPRLPNWYFLNGDLYLQDYPNFSNRTGSIPNTPPIQIVSRGLAVGQIGVEEIGFVVPTNQPPGDWALFFNVNHVSSPYVKLPVR
jgi:uncharacterized protein (TIGR03437 family)